MVSVRRFLGLTAMVGAGAFSALLGHAAIGAIERAGFLGAGYLEHAHTSVPAAIVGAFFFLCAAAILYGLQVLDGGRRAHVLGLAKAFASSRPALVTIPLVAVATLAAMEASEGAFAGAFGSMPLAGILIVAGVGLGIALLLRAFARWIAAATQYLVAAVLFFVRRCEPKPPVFERRPFDSVRIKRNAAFRRLCALRAPPFVLA